MASAVACKGAPLASLLKKLLAEPSASGALRPASLTAARRLLNTNGSEVRCYDDDDTSDESGSEYEDADAAGGRRRLARDFTAPSFFSQGTYIRVSSLLLLRVFRRVRANVVGEDAKKNQLLPFLISQTCSTDSARRRAWAGCWL
jgi:hypothetical protein